MRGSRVQEFTLQGLNLDSSPGALGADVWTAAANFRSTGSGMTRADGERVYTAGLPGVGPAMVPKWALLFQNGLTPKLLLVGDAAAKTTDGNTWVSVFPSTGWSAFTGGEMTGGVLQGVPVLNAPTMAPWYLDQAANLLKPLPGWLAGKQARVLAPFNQHLFAGSLIAASVDNDAVAWSDLAAPGSVPATWVPTATNQAGDLSLGTGVGPIQVMQGLAQSLMVYRTSGCWAITYSGRPFIYTARKVSSEVGAASMNACVQVNGAHAVIAPGDFVLTDGTSARSIGEGRVKRSLFAQISEQGLKRCHAYSIPARNEVVFCLALGRDDACNFAYVWDTARDKWSTRELPLITHTATGLIPLAVAADLWSTDAGPWSTDDKPWDSPPAGGYRPGPLGVSPNNANAYQLDVGNARASGAAIAAALERSALLIGPEPRVKFFTAIHPRIDGAPGDVVTVRIGTQMTPSDPVTWSQALPWTIGQSRRLDCNAQGRYASVRFEATNVSPWSVAGFGIEYGVRGYA